MKKTTITTIITLSTMIASAAALSAAPPSGGPGGGPLPVIDTNLKDYIEGVVNNAIHQDTAPIYNAEGIQAINTAQASLTYNKKVVSETAGVPMFGIPAKQTETIQPVQESLPPAEAARKQAEIATTNNIRNSLKQFFYSMYHSDDNIAKTVTTAEDEPFSQYTNENSLTSLSVGTTTQADDTLYVANASDKSSYEGSTTKKPWLAPPTEKHNDFMDFATLITPTSYTPKQLTAVNNFVKYAAQSTQDLTAGIDFGALYGKPNALLTIKQNPVYQKFMLSVRNLIAMRSIVLNSLNQLIAERTPMKGLGAAAGLQSNQEASPLQVEAYQANHRINDPKWYAAVQNESSATVQRETLIVLAEIEHQNYEAHLDREHLIAAIDAIALQSNASATGGVLTEGASKVNDLISSATTPTPPSVKNTSTGESNQAVAGVPEKSEKTEKSNKNKSKKK